MTEQSLFDLPQVADNNLGKFHNSVGYQEPELSAFKMKALTQDKAVLAFFRKHDGINFNASEVWRYMKLPNVPITSIRRSITNLTKADCLVESGNMRMGNYGRKTKCWRAEKYGI